MTSRKTLLLVAVVLALAGAGLWISRTYRPKPARVAAPRGTPLQIPNPLGLPPVSIPADNPPTAETIALGRRLYYDPGLSVDNTVSCASCHNPSFGFTDGKPVSEGVRGQKGGRSAPTIINAAYNTLQFWDGRAPSLEKQAEGPVQNPLEMAHTLEGVEKKLGADPSYQAAFERAFGTREVTYEMVEKAIASFERTVLSGNSPFDRYFYGGDRKALSEPARRGLEVFRDSKKGNCATCHVIGERHALLADNKFHNLGVGVKLGISGEPEITDLGRYNVTKIEADKGAFKTPTLRNIALTGPYMHDGSRKTLKEVIDFYIGAGNSNPNRDKEIRALDFLTGQERADLLAFLQSLTGEIPPDKGPP